jgi:hypothetical protein
MSLLNKFRAAPARESAAPPVVARGGVPGKPLHAPGVSSGAGNPSGPGRFSNGLKEFLWQLHDVKHGKLLDMGAVSQTTLNFFIDRGFRVYTEDFLGTWGAFLQAEEENLKSLPAGVEAPDRSWAARAERFLGSNMSHPADTFDAVLLWDVLDYVDHAATACIAAHLGTLVREGGAILGVFHARMPTEFHRYRVLDASNLEFVPAPTLMPPQHVFQNREIQDLFEGFRSSKTFVGRDQVREGVFIK